MKPTSNQIVNKSSVVGSTITEALNALNAATGGAIDWDDLLGKPATFPPDPHVHPISDVTNLQTSLDAKQATLVSGSNIKTVNGNSLLGSGDLVISGGGGGGGVTDHGALTGLADDDHTQYHTDARGDARYSALGHGHVISDVTGLQTALDGKAAASHTHTATEISDSTAVGRSVLTAVDAAAARTAIGAGTGNGDATLAGTQTFTGAKTFSVTTELKVAKFNGEYNAGNSGTSVTVDFANGQKQVLTLTGNATVTLAFPGVGDYKIRLVQDGTGSRTVAWSGVTKWVGSATQPAINTAASSETLVGIYYNGSNAYLGAVKVNA